MDVHTSQQASFVQCGITPITNLQSTIGTPTAPANQRATCTFSHNHPYTPGMEHSRAHLCIQSCSTTFRLRKTARPCSVASCKPTRGVHRLLLSAASGPPARPSRSSGRWPPFWTWVVLELGGLLKVVKLMTLPRMLCNGNGAISHLQAEMEFVEDFRYSLYN